MKRFSSTSPDGFQLSAQVTGRDGGPTVLLLPGQANSHQWWAHLREVFDERFQVLTFDYRGTGNSRGPVGDWSTSLFAADAALVLRHIADAPAAVYGTSMGGRVAQMLAIDHPQAVGRLVLACTSPGGPHAHERTADIRRALADPDPDARRRTLVQLFYTDGWAHRAEDSDLLGDPTMTPVESRAHLRVSAAHDAWDRLAAVAAPTLVLHGTEDLMVPTVNAGLIAERVPGAVLELFRGGRHGFFDEFSAAITPRVLSFLG